MVFGVDTRFVFPPLIATSEFSIIMFELTNDSFAYQDSDDDSSMSDEEDEENEPLHDTTSRH